jgi:uncharacterized protein
MSFLTAEWRKLVLVNYIIDPYQLQKYVPAKTTIDLFNNRCYISLVGFMFCNTKLMGYKIPFHTNFEEVNLRFYVERKDGDTWKRGVVFIKEIVPKRALTFIANIVYKEHYQTLPMNHRWLTRDKTIDIGYDWKIKGATNSVSVIAGKELHDIKSGSETEFITEHFWGYTRMDEKTTYEYEVKHPRWQVYKVENWFIEVDFKDTYGDDFEFLNSLPFESVMLAEGSEIRVEKPVII